MMKPLLPGSILTRLGAPVAPPRCPVLRAGTQSLSRIGASTLMDISIADDHRKLPLQRDPWMSRFLCSPRYQGEYHVSPCPNGSLSRGPWTTICPLGEPEIGLGYIVSDRTMVG